MLLVGGAGALWWFVSSSGCGSSDYSTVVVRATDARTGAPLARQAEERGMIIVRDGEYADTGQLRWGAGHNDRPRMYHVSVRVPGYREWTTRGALVRYQGPCRLKPVVLTAQLRPED